MPINLTREVAGSFTYYEGKDRHKQDVPNPDNFKLLLIPFATLNSTGTRFDASISIKDSWEKPALRGVYLFLKFQKKPDLTVLIPKLQQFLNHASRKHTRFLWIENADTNTDADASVDMDVEDWKREEISVDPDSNVVDKDTFWDFRNYSLMISRGSTISWQERKGSSPSEHKEWLVFRKPDAEGKEFRFRASYGAEEIGETSPEIHLTMAGKGIASLQFALTLPGTDLRGAHTGEFRMSYPGLRELDISLRMFFRDPSLPGMGDDFSLDSLRCPLFNEVLHHPLAPRVEEFYPESLQFAVQLDRFHPLDGNRSFLLILTDFPTGIPSGYRTHMGFTVHLKRIPEEHRLVFHQNPTFNLPSEAHALYLVPKGDFQMWIPIYNPKPDQNLDLEHNLVCGLSGVEYIRIASNPEFPTKISFFPEQRAFVKNFKSVSVLRQEVLELLAELSGHVLVAPDPQTVPPTPVLDDPEVNFITLDFGDTDTHDGVWLPIFKDFFDDSFQLTAKLKSQLNNDDQVDDGVDTPEKLLKWISDRYKETRSIGTDLDEGDLGGIAHTSWVYVQNTQGKAPVYYSQPDQSVLYKDTQESGNDPYPEDEFLAFLEIPTYRLLAEVPDDAKRIPIFPYGGGLDTFYLEDFKQMEEGFLNPFRQDRIHSLDQQAHTLGLDSLRKLPPGELEDQQGTTPQGFIVTYGSDADKKSFEHMQSLDVGKGTDGNMLRFTKIGRESELRAALLSNQLFLVATAPDSLKEFWGNLNGLDSKLDIDSWVFSMHPDLWELYDTLIVFKFHNQPMLDLAKNTFAWSQPTHFSNSANRSLEKTQKDVIRILEEAVEKFKEGGKEDREKYGKLAQAALEPGWSGILALQVPISSPPTDIQAIMAGINPADFFAKYIGIEATPVKPKLDRLIADHSASFGLIDYEDDGLPPPNDSGYNFQVNKLFARFNNASLVDFSIEMTLTIDRLFDEKTRLRNSPDGRNIVLIKGTVELHEGKDLYKFRFEGDNEFELPFSEAMRVISIHSVDFTTDPPKDDSAKVGSRELTGRFLMSGGIDFQELPGFDILSFGDQKDQEPGEERVLKFSQLEVRMDSKLAPLGSLDRAQNTFRFDSSKLAIDLSQSKVRDNSLFAKFPLKFTGFKFSGANQNDDPAQTGSVFTDLGFMPVEVVTEAPQLSSTADPSQFIPPPPPLIAPTALASDPGPRTWYTLTFDLDLGTVGSLANDIGLTVSICAAWIPQGMVPTPIGSETRGVFVGLKLPGSTGGKKEIELQGLLKLVFKKIQFVSGKNDKDELFYLLKLKNIVLKFLVLSLPPSAQSEIIIFGDPNQLSTDDGSFDQEQKKLVGWYASFIRK